MKNEKLFELIGSIDEEFIKEAGEEAMKDNGKKRGILTKWTAGVAAAAAISVILPNINGDIAMAMEKIPVLGKYFEIVTFRDYEYKDTHNEAEVSIPQIDTVDGATEEEVNTAEALNRSIEEYASEFITEFEENLQKEGYQGLQVDYEVITDNEEWLTIKVNVLQTEASGFSQAKFYHVDKQTGKQIKLTDLFVDGSDYVKIISENIISQMKEQMAADDGKIYFFEGDGEEEEGNFKEIKADQNFYFNEQGELVLAFDEYEVAPGYMGNVEFVIPEKIVEDIYK